MWHHYVQFTLYNISLVAGILENINILLYCISHKDKSNIYQLHAFLIHSFTNYLNNMLDRVRFST